MPNPVGLFASVNAPRQSTLGASTDLLNAIRNQPGGATPEQVKMLLELYNTIPTSSSAVDMLIGRAGRQEKENAELLNSIVRAAVQSYSPENRRAQDIYSSVTNARAAEAAGQVKDINAATEQERQLAFQRAPGGVLDEEEALYNTPQALAKERAGLESDPARLSQLKAYLASAAVNKKGNDEFINAGLNPDDYSGQPDYVKQQALEAQKFHDMVKKAQLMSSTKNIVDQENLPQDIERIRQTAQATAEGHAAGQPKPPLIRETVIDGKKVFIFPTGAHMVEGEMTDVDRAEFNRARRQLDSIDRDIRENRVTNPKATNIQVTRLQQIIDGILGRYGRQGTSVNAPSPQLPSGMNIRVYNPQTRSLEPAPAR